VSSDGKAMK
jgi:hypothetical protein